MVTKEELEKYQRAYSQGRPLITDEEYDRLLEEYVRDGVLTHIARGIPLAMWVNCKSVVIPL